VAESRSESGKSKAKSDARTTRTSWALVERVLASASVARAYLYGPPGVGKTFAAVRARAGGARAYVVTLTQEMPSSELRGTWIPRGGELAWLDGPVVRAMREGGLVVINELLHASEDALSFLYPVLEMPETARLTLPTGETLQPAPGFRVIVTENHPPSELPPPLRDRFDVVLEIAEPHPKALEALSPELRTLARRSFALEEDRRVSVRGWLVLDRLQHELGLEDACLAVFGPERGSQIYDALLLARAGRG
jgi:MoxR-like ATPase